VFSPWFRCLALARVMLAVAWHMVVYTLGSLEATPAHHS
jgi:hypothetical protein